ncbi:MAG: hypothetical protein NVSMB64_22900 [Candidatus Velthaea sp.]
MESLAIAKVWLCSTSYTNYCSLAGRNICGYLVTSLFCNTFKVAMARCKADGYEPTYIPKSIECHFVADDSVRRTYYVSETGPPVKILHELPDLR